MVAATTVAALAAPMTAPALGADIQSAGTGTGAVVTSTAAPARRSHVGLTWYQYLQTFTDWNPYLMSRIAWCESRDEPTQINQAWVWASWAGGWVHAVGLLGVLGGSTNPFVNIRQAHRLYRKAGYSPWALDFETGCV